jgi:hypothetical protein
MKGLLNFSISFLFLFVSYNLLGHEGINSVTVLSREEAKKSNLKFLDLGNGAEMAPRHDGINYFINANWAEREKPSTSAIDEAISKGKIYNVTDLGDLSGAFLEEAFVKLPVTFRIYKEGENDGEVSSYDVTVLAMNFTPDSVYFSIGCKFIIPGQSGGSEVIYFGGKDIGMNFKGGSFSGTIKIIEPGEFLKNINLGSNIKFKLGPETSLTFNCGKFTKFTLDGNVLLNDNIAISEDREGKPINDGYYAFYFQAQVEHWKDLLLTLRPPKDAGFHLPSYPDIGFWFSDPKTSAENPYGEIILDLSANINAPSTDPLVCSDNTWKGIYIQTLSLRLPSFFKNRNGGTDSESMHVVFNNAIIGNTGIYGGARIDGSNLLGLADGQLDQGWDVSIESIGFERKTACNGGNEQLSFSLGGKVRPPLFEKDKPFSYTLHLASGGDFEFNIVVPPGATKLELFQGFASFELTTMGLKAIRDDEGKRDLVGNIGISGCISITGKDNSLDLGLKVQNLLLSTKRPFIQGVESVQLGCSGNGISFGFGGFEVDINGNANLTVKDSNAIRVNFGLGVGLGDSEDGNSFKASGNFVLLGHLEQGNDGRYSYKNDSLGITGLYVKGVFGQVLSFEGGVNSFDSPDLGKGFKGGMTLTLNIGGGTASSFGVTGSVEAIFGKKTNFKFWYLDVSIGFPNGIQMGTFVLKGVNGAGYKNILMGGANKGNEGSGFSFEPKAGAWGFRFGVMMGLGTAKVPVNINGMLEIAGVKNGGIQTVFLAADVNFDLDNKQTNITDNFKRLVNNTYSVFQSHNAVFKGEDSNNKGQANIDKDERYRNATNEISKAFKPASAANRIGVSAMIWINFGNSPSLNAILYPDINIEGGETLKASVSGFGMLHFSPGEWFINIGRSEPGQRLRLDASVPGISVFVETYLMIGHGIQSSLPPPQVPSNFARAFSSVSNKYNGGACTSCGEVGMGKGFAFGMAAGVEIKANVLLRIFSVNVRAGAGFDAIMTSTDCDAGWGSGSSRFRARGQVYGYFDAGIKFLGQSLFSLGAGFKLQGEGFKPLYASGNVLLYIKLRRKQWDLNVRMEMGNMANCPPPIMNADFKFKALGESFPANNAVDVSRNVNARLFFGDGDSSLKKDDDGKTYSPNEYSDQTLLQAVIQGATRSKVIYEDTGVEITGTWVSTKVNGSDQIVFRPAVPYEPNKKVQVTCVMQLLDEDGAPVLSNENTVALQTETFSFTTAGNSKIYLTGEKSLPYKNQYNAYLEDSEFKLKVDTDELRLANLLCPDCQISFMLTDLADGVISKADNVKLFLGQQGFSFYPDRLNFWNIPVENGKVYKMGLGVTYPDGSSEVTYDNHYFRVSDYSSFSEKIDFINQNKRVLESTNSNGIPVWTLECDDSNGFSDFEWFSQQEMSEIIKQNLNARAGTIELLEEIEVDPHDNTDYTAFNPLAKLRYNPGFNIDFKNGVVTKNRNDQGITRWELDLFSDFIFNGLPNYSHVDANFYYDSGQEEIDVEHKEETINLQGIIDFRVGDFNLKNYRNKQHVIEVKCKREALDHSPIGFEVTMFESESKKTVAFPSPDNLTLRFSTNDSLLIKKGESSWVYSGFKSINTCPNAFLPSSNISSRYYVINSRIERPEVTPYVEVTCNPIIQSVGQHGLRAEGSGGEETASVDDNPVFEIVHYGIQIRVFDDPVLRNPQQARQPITVTLKNGITCTLTAGNSERFCDLGFAYQTTQNPDHYNYQSPCEKIETVSGGNTNQHPSTPKNFSKLWQVSESSSSLLTSCKMNSSGNPEVFTVSLYTDSADSNLEEGVFISSTTGSVKFNPINGYYSLKNSTQWIKVEDGKIIETGNCDELAPYVSEECIIVSSSVSSVYRGVKLSFYFNKEDRKPYTLTEALEVTLKNGERILIPNGVSTYTHTLKENEDCTGIESIPDDFGNDPEAMMCKKVLAKPVISTQNTRIDLGERVTLSVENCDGQVRWFGVIGSGNSVSIYPNPAISYAAQCENGTCKSEVSDNIKFTYNPFVITHETAKGELICEGDKVSLISSGCAGQVRWVLSHGAVAANVELYGKEVEIENFNIRLTGKGHCLLESGASVPSENEFNLFSNTVPAGVSITSSIQDMANVVCVDEEESIVLSASGSCNTPYKLKWYYDTGFSYENRLIQSPQVNTSYYAVCENKTTLGSCESIPSNTILAKAIKHTKPVISYIPILENCTSCALNGGNVRKEGSTTIIKLCQGEQIALSSSPCVAGEETGNLIWEAKTPAGIIVSDFNLASAGIPMTYKVKCRIFHCDSEWSDEFKVEVYNRPPTPVVSSTLSANSYLCTKNGSGTVRLTASNCLSDQTAIWFKNGSLINHTGLTLDLSSEDEAGSYSAKCKGGSNCQSTMSVPVIVDIRTIPDAPVAQHGKACDGQNVTIGAAGCSGDYLWSNQLPIASDHTISGLNIATHTYTVRCSVNSCESSNTTVRAVVHPYPVIAGTPEMTICQGKEVQLNATCDLGNIIWPSGVSAEGKVSPGATTSYVVACESNDCRTQYTIKVNVNPNPSAPSMGGSGSFCDNLLVSAECAEGMIANWVNESHSTLRKIEETATTSKNYEAFCTNPGTSCISSVSTRDVKIFSTPTVSVSEKDSKSVVCSGTSITLEADCSGSVVSWSHSLGNKSSVTFTPSQTETYTAYCSDNGECTVSDTISVEVKRKPEDPSVTGNIDGCEGTILNVSCTATTDKIKWADLAVINSNTGNRNIVSSGEYSVRCEADNGCVSEWVTRSVSISSRPVLTFTGGGTTICSGQSTTISANCSIGNLKWDNNSTESSRTVTPSSDATYSATCSNETCHVSSSVDIFVNPTPSMPEISGSTNACENTTLTASCDLYSAIEWEGGSVSSLNSEDKTIYSSGTYKARCIHKYNYCSSEWESVTVSISSRPTISITGGGGTICSGETVTLTANCNGGSLSWDNGSTESQRTVTPYNNATYSATCTNGYCSVSATSTAITVNSRPSSPSLSGSTSFCAGGSTTLSASCGSGISAKWENSGTSTLTLTDGGTYYAYCEQNGCRSSSASVTVNVVSPSTPEHKEDKGCGIHTFSATCENGDPNVIRNRWNKWPRTYEDVSYGASASFTSTPDFIGMYAVCEIGSCESPAVKIGEVDVPPGAPSAPTITSSHTTLGKYRTSVTINSNCGSGTTAKWNTGSTNHSISVSEAGSYSAQCSRDGVEGCISSESNTITITKVTWSSVTYVVSGNFMDSAYRIYYINADGDLQVDGPFSIDVRGGEEEYMIEVSGAHWIEWVRGSGNSRIKED